MNECPCGTQKDYQDCCEKIILGQEMAETAEALMRSRYTAFAKGLVDYLFETHHQSTRSSLDRKEVENWSKNSEWLGLTIKNIEKGGRTDTKGLVEFVASFKIDGTLQNHHEKASFEKGDEEKWYFKDGKVMVEPYKRVSEKIGRNDPCLCSSGKKYKKCCGRGK